MKSCLMIESQVFHLLQIQTKITPKSSNFSQRKPSCWTKMKYIAMSHKPKEESVSNYRLYDSSPLSSSLKETKGNECEGRSLVITLTGVAASILMMMMGIGNNDKAWALGPEGPLMEEFWENVRRYGLYALTVSTGVLYAVFQPIFELLKNPISAILILLIIGGTLFIGSQILSAMVGVSDFSYQYSY